MSSAPIELILSKLPDAKRNSSGWSARCPAHDDRRASLSIGVGDDDKVLICCHADCKPEAIVAALGLHMSDLMPGDGDKTSSRPKKTGIVPPSPRPTGKTYATDREAVADLERRHGRRSGWRQRR